MQEAGLFTSLLIMMNQCQFNALNSGLLSVWNTNAVFSPQRVKPHCESFLFHKKKQKMRREKLKLGNSFKRIHEPTDLHSFKNFLKLYTIQRRNLKTFFYEKLAELDPKQLHKTINLLLIRSKDTVFPSAADASQLFQPTLLRNLFRLAPISTHRYSLIYTNGSCTNGFRTFQPAINSAVFSVVKSSMRSISPADSIPVPLLCTIINSIRPTITVSSNCSLATGIVSDAL